MYANSESDTIIDLIRHGEPVGGRRYRGQTDDPLSEKGWNQMWGAVGHGAPWSRIVTSPLQRCSAFAYALAERHALPIKEDPRLMEVGFGDWEGRTASEIRERDPAAIPRFYANPLLHRPAGAEALDVFVERVRAAWADLVEQHVGERVLVVCHAGVIRAVVAHLLDVDVTAMYRIQVENATVARVRIGTERPPSVVLAGTPFS